MIYLLEDDSSIRELVTYTLGSVGLEATGFETPADFWKAMAKQRPSLILLDIMLPDEDGISILKKLRRSSATEKIPVMMITAKGTEYDKVLGLDSGADDYLAKPFGMMEMLARVRALLRRFPEEQQPVSYTIRGLYLCPAKHIVRAEGRDVTLTYKEYELLCLLAENRGVVFTRQQLLNKIWGYDFDGENRTVDVHINTLRQKLGPCASVIETVRGIGYKIGEDE